MPSTAKLVQRMRWWCASANLGYSQADRWNIRVGGNCDCSSLVIHCLQEAGFSTGSATYTGNLSANLTARGWKRIANNGNPLPGDVLLNDTHHVAVYLGNGLLAQASSSEYGSAYGRPGDQTGRETNIRRYYNYPWNCYLRYAGRQSTTPAVKPKPKEYLQEVIDQMKATHIIFQYGGALGVANILAGTYELFANSADYKDRCYVIKRAGGKLVTWGALRGRKGSDANKIGNLEAMGKRL